MGFNSVFKGLSRDLYGAMGQYDPGSPVFPVFPTLFVENKVCRLRDRTVKVASTATVQNKQKKVINTSIPRV